MIRLHNNVIFDVVWQDALPNGALRVHGMDGDMRCSTGTHTYVRLDDVIVWG